MMIEVKGTIALNDKNKQLNEAFRHLWWLKYIKFNCFFEVQIWSLSWFWSNDIFQQGYKKKLIAT